MTEKEIKELQDVVEEAIDDNLTFFNELAD